MSFIPLESWWGDEVKLFLDPEPLNGSPPPKCTFSRWPNGPPWIMYPNSGPLNMGDEWDSFLYSWHRCLGANPISQINCRRNPFEVLPVFLCTQILKTLIVRTYRGYFSVFFVQRILGGIWTGPFLCTYSTSHFPMTRVHSYFRYHYDPILNHWVW